MRKLIGAVAMLFVIAIYSFAVMLTAAALQVRNAGTWVELVFYAVAGLLWTLPIGWLIKWMQRP